MAASPKPQPSSPLKALLLGDALNDLAAQTGIHFELADELKRDKVSSATDGKASNEAAQALLRGYNYVVETGPNGAWQRVTISGRNGDGTANAESGAASQPPARKIRGVASRFQAVKPSALIPVTLPLATLKGMKLGKTVLLEVPGLGPTLFKHDNRYQHSNGELTWVGYPNQDGEQDGQPYRAMITLGKSGPMGHILTPDGDYQIVSEDGQTYLLDLNASGLQPGSLLEDQATAHPSAEGGISIVAPISSAAQKAAGTPAAPSDPSQTAAAKSQTLATIDLLVLYSKGLALPETRANYLISLANQAFLDSKINAKLRLVKLQAVDYGEANDNEQALTELTQGSGAFAKISGLREKYGADLVTLIRPFHAASQKGCGVAWINGGNGSGLSANLGYSVVSDGNDLDGQPVYCGDQTLAHEIGHNLGNVHDRPFTTEAGAYPYSYGWGVEGRFGTIMSYRRPGVYLFANPLLEKACQGLPCGNPADGPDAADNAATINQTAPIAAGFQTTVVPSVH